MSRPLLLLVSMACSLYAAFSFVHVAPPFAQRFSVARARTGLSMSAPPLTSPHEENTRPRNVQGIESQDDFMQALGRHANDVAVVLFYDKACRACAAVAPKFDRLSLRYGDCAGFYEVEFTSNKPLCKNLDIKVLPTVQIYRGSEGKVLDTPCGPKKFPSVADGLARILAEVQTCCPDGCKTLISFPDLLLPCC
ncbi:unnamed protein product [Chrysoparadoxa australica]